LESFDSVVRNASWQISSVDALSAAERQKLFFKSVDGFVVDPTAMLPAVGQQKNSFDMKVEAACKKLPSS